MTPVNLPALAIGIAILLFAVGSYIRFRIQTAETMAAQEPLVTDGWYTFSDDPDYQTLHTDLQNEAFGSLCRTALMGFVVLAMGFGLDVRHDVFAFLMDLR